ncbi:MAG: hypothetical protein ACI4ED_09715 [Suilimivivens sp.]
MKKIRKILATLLAFAMLFGSSMTVFADDPEQIPDFYFEEVDNDISEDDLYAKVSGNPILNNFLGSEFYNVISDRVEHELPNNSCLALAGFLHYEHGICFDFFGKDSSGNIWSKAPVKLSYLSNVDHIYVLRYSTGSSTTPSADSTEIEETHEHSYSWETVQDATVDQDGMEEYRCSCGDVKERSVIPASQAFVKGLHDKVKNAPLNGVVQYDSRRMYTMSDYIIKQLAERSDVTTVITFEYEKKSYKMVIPAGVDYSALLNDEENFYGYFYFAKVTGATIEER